MQNVTKLMEIAVSVFIFCVAGTLFLMSNREMNHLITLTKNEVSNQNIYYENERALDEIQESKITYDEIISTLLGDLDYDIQIDDMTILKENYNYQEFDFSTVPQAEFTKSYEYDSSGNIVKVIYKS